MGTGVGTGTSETSDLSKSTCLGIKSVNGASKGLGKTTDEMIMHGLWKLYATNMLLRDYKIWGRDMIREKIYDNWSNLTDGDLEMLFYQHSYLEDLSADASELRAYLIFYKEFLDEEKKKKSYVKTTENEKMFLRTTLRNWKKLSKPKKDKLLRDASNRMIHFPLPKRPLRDPSIKTETLKKASYGSLVPLADDPLATNDLEEISDLSIEELGSKAIFYGKLLDQLKVLTSKDDSKKSLHWTRKIEMIQSQGTISPVKVCLIGATGAGKSSIINALLGESLVPTSCWAACTAVVTEVGCNLESGAPYRAVVNFISRKEWQDELGVLLSDMLDENGKVIDDAQQKCPEVGIAWDKVSAVYPDLRKSDIAKLTEQDLLGRNDVTHYLSSQKEFSAETPEDLSAKLKSMVASKTKVVQTNTTDTASSEIWPLVRSVQIFARSDFLQSGVVLVDLPGVYDSNRARASVAQKYLEDCSNIWIVTPMTRAADDKFAKDLLGDSFKRQLRMDNMYGSVAIVGTKSDDIGPVQEVISSLGIETQILSISERKSLLEQQARSWESELDCISEQLDGCEKNHVHIEEQIRTYQHLKSILQNVATVPAPTLAQPSRKRLVLEDVGSNKKRRANAYSFSSRGSTTSEIAQTAPERMLNKLDVETKLSELQQQLDVNQVTGTALLEKSSTLEDQIYDVAETLDNLKSEAWQLCVRTRSEMTKNAIKSDFVNGIRELDQHLAQDSPDFNPDIDLRDYEEISSKLPVFCVSPRGYQRLICSNNDERAADQFTKVDQTEIPALKNHAVHMAQESKKSHLLRYISRTERLCTSMELWASGDTLSKLLTEDQARAERDHVQNLVRDLREKLVFTCECCVDTVTKDIQTNIFNPLPKLVTKAKAAAAIIVQGWGLPVSESGLPWQTYRAVVRHDGDFTSSNGIHHSFNKQLNTPLMDSIDIGWGRTFEKQVPASIDRGKESSAEALFKLHNTIEARVKELGLASSMMQLLKTQLLKHKEQLGDDFQVFGQLVERKQKKANRKFGPVILDNLKPIYAKAKVEKGTGFFKRLKVIMEEGVKIASGRIYSAASKAVRKVLEDAMMFGGKDLVNDVKNTAREIERDYSSLFSMPDRKLSDTEVQLREAVAEIIHSHIESRDTQSPTVIKIKVEEIDPIQLATTTS